MAIAHRQLYIGWYTDTYCNPDSDSDSYGYGYANSDRYGYTNSHSRAHADPFTDTDQYIWHCLLLLESGP